MIVVWAGAEPHAVSDRVHTVDLAVTLVSRLGVAVPDNVDGVGRSRSVGVDRRPPTGR